MACAICNPLARGDGANMFTCDKFICLVFQLNYLAIHRTATAGTRPRQENYVYTCAYIWTYECA